MRTLRGVLSLAALGTAVIVPGLQRADAYETYSENGDATNCRSCHGDFRASPYTSLKPGEGDWSSSLHNVHRYDMLEGDCDVCHGGLGGSRLPVSIYSSDGGLGLPAIGCIGCHGRDAGGGSTGVGLRQKHFRAGQTLCVTCHSDSDPAQAIPVGENTMPAYYFTPDSNHPNKPTDPCNPGSAFVEGRYGASSLGLDNDGDGAYDANDTDCQATVATPGEANGMQVTNFDGQTGQITVSYTPGCSTSDNTIEYGLLAELSAYAYEGQVCAIANTGSATFTLPSGSYFFLVVGNDGANEGSYGLGVGEAERPEDSTSASCPLPQDLSQRCD
jgi:hypothetical protein